MSAPRWFGVSSPEYCTGGHSGGLEPPEWWRDWLPVFTDSARRARLLAVRAWKRRRSEWWRHRERSENPFARVVATPLVPCEHGKVFDCEACDEEWMYLADIGAEIVP